MTGLSRNYSVSRNDRRGSIVIVCLIMKLVEIYVLVYPNLVQRRELVI